MVETVRLVYEEREGLFLFIMLIKNRDGIVGGFKVILHTIASFLEQIVPKYAVSQILLQEYSFSHTTD